MSAQAIVRGCALSLLGVCASAAQPSATLQTDGTLKLVWQRQFVSKLDDWINQMIRLSDGHYLVVGFLNRSDTGPTATDWRALAVKLDETGETVWAREHGAGGGVDAYWAAQEGADGRLATGGFTTRIGAGGIDAHVAVLDSEGWIVKENAFGASGYDRFTDIAATPDGGYMLVGFTEVDGAPKHRDVLLLKTNANGAEQWRRTFGGPGHDVALYLEPTADRGYILAGGVSGADGSDGDILVMKVDEDGKQQWRRIVGAPETNDTNHGLALYPDGRILVVGYTQSWNARVIDMVAATLSADGAVTHHEIFGGPDDDRVMMTRIDKEGRAWLTGYTKSAGAGAWDAFVTRLTPSGAFEGFLSTLGGPEDDQGTSILPLDDGGFLLGGYSSNLGGGQQDAFVLRAEAPAWKHKPEGFKRRVVGDRERKQ